MKAAQTGHLVLSTLHTNDSVSAIVRLLDLGIPGYLISSSVTGILAQRLVRMLCSCHSSSPRLRNFRRGWPKWACPSPRSRWLCPSAAKSATRPATRAESESMNCCAWMNPFAPSFAPVGTSTRFAKLPGANGMRLMQEDALEKVLTGDDHAGRDPPSRAHGNYFVCGMREVQSAHSSHIQFLPVLRDALRGQVLLSRSRKVRLGFLKKSTDHGQKRRQIE